MPPIAWPSVHLIQIPDARPPYDCETHGAACPVARDQASDLAARAAEVLAAPVGPGASSAGGLPGGMRGSPGGAGGSADGTGASPGGAGTTGAWPRQFAQVMVEILAGVRPQRQIVPWTTDRVRAQIRHIGPALATDRQPRIRRVVTSRPTASAVEMTVVVSFGPRLRALAMRLEYVDAREAGPGLPTRPARWLCTELETA